MSRARNITQLLRNVVTHSHGSNNKKHNKNYEIKRRSKGHGESSALLHFPLFSGYMISLYGCPRYPFIFFQGLRRPWLIQIRKPRGLGKFFKQLKLGIACSTCWKDASIGQTSYCFSPFGHLGLNHFLQSLRTLQIISNYSFSSLSLRKTYKT